MDKLVFPTGLKQNTQNRSQCSTMVSRYWEPHSLRVWSTFYWLQFVRLMLGLRSSCCWLHFGSSVWHKTTPSIVFLSFGWVEMWSSRFHRQTQPVWQLFNILTIVCWVQATVHQVPGTEGSRTQSNEPSDEKQRGKQRLGITSALCIRVCTRTCARLAAFRMKSGNILVCPAEGSALWHRLIHFLSWSFIDKKSFFFFLVELSASDPSMGVWKKHCITLWSKRKTIELKTASLAILPFPCNKALHPQSMIVKNTRMLLFSMKIPLIQQLSP